MREASERVASDLVNCGMSCPCVCLQLRRFITLVDCLYEARTRVLILAEADPRGLFDKSANADSAQDEVFAFDRTASRLIEMQGQDYAQRSVQSSQRLT